MSSTTSLQEGEQQLKKRTTALAATNPSIERTSPGKPGAAAHVERYPARNTMPVGAAAIKSRSLLPPIPMPKHRIFTTAFAKVYPQYVQKAERKGRTRQEVDQVICWLAGYDQAGLKQQLEHESNFETFFAQAPAIHPNSALIKGVVCGVRVQDIEDPLMQKIRYLDRLIDELAKGKALESILRSTGETKPAPRRARHAG